MYLLKRIVTVLGGIERNDDQLTPAARKLMDLVRK